MGFGVNVESVTSELCFGQVINASKPQFLHPLDGAGSTQLTGECKGLVYISEWKIGSRSGF